MKEQYSQIRQMVKGEGFLQKRQQIGPGMVKSGGETVMRIGVRVA